MLAGSAMVPVRPLLIVLGLFAAAAGAAANATCGTGLSRFTDLYADCCVVPCNTTAEFKQNPCEPADICYPCRQGTLCDGVSYRDCPSGMASPRGSTSEGDCLCHRGHVQDGATCTVCPEGSWCDGSGAQSCPSGMTSNRASVAQEDCFCPEGYTGGLDCAGRENATHHRCNPGYRFDSVDNTDPGAPFDDCQIGPSNAWCDGTACLGCPTEDQGVSYEFGKTSYAECFCPFGYTTLVDQGPCVPCPPDGVQDASEALWTRGVNCAVTYMSVVSFTATLEVPLTEFDARRAEVTSAVAETLWVPVDAVAVAQASDGGAADGDGARRLLGPASSVNVQSTVTVPTADAAFVVNAATSEGLTRVLAARTGLRVATVSAAESAAVAAPANPDAPASTPAEDASSSSSLAVPAIAVSATLLVAVGATVAWYRYQPRKPRGYNNV
jgi:hypothetical protein